MDTAKTTDLGDALSIIASVPPDADRDTLLAAINQTVDNIIADKAGLGGEPPPPEQLKAAHTLIGFLQACCELGDEEFRNFIKGCARELEVEFIATAGGGTEPEKPTHDNFEDAFADYFSEFILSRLEPFHLKAEEAPLPYMLNPAFSEVFGKAIRDHVLPDIMAHRRVRGFADSIVQSNIFKSTFFTEFSKPKQENVVRLLWTNAMQDFAAVIQLADTPVNEDDKKTKKKKRGYFGKKKDPTLSNMTVIQRGAKAEAFWKIMADGSKEHNYDAPQAEDMDLFEVLMDYKLADIEKNKSAVRQLLIQQNTSSSNDGVCEDATRDHLCRIVDSMEPHCGELIILWAYHAYRDIFPPEILHSFIAVQGATDEQRKQKIPVFLRGIEEDIRRNGPRG